MVSIKTTPLHAALPPVVAVARYCRIMGAFVLFTSVCAGMDVVPLPEAPVIPDGTLQVQLKLTPGVVDVKVTAVDGNPEQMVCFDRENWILGDGFTVMVKLEGNPLHKLPSGVIVMLAVTGVVPALTGLNAGILPVPLAANPMELLLFVQEYELAVPVSEIAADATPLHKTKFAGTVTVGRGVMLM